MEQPIQLLSLREWNQLPLIYTCVTLAVLISLAHQTVKFFAFHRNLYKLYTPHQHDYFWFMSQQTRNEFLTNCGDLLHKGFANSGDVIRLHTAGGQVAILSPRFARHINADVSVSPGKFTQRELFGDVPGLEPFKFASSHRALMRDVISTRLNKSFDLNAKHISIEASDAIKSRWGDSVSFHEITLHQTVLKVIAQTSIRCFLGPELCRDEHWLDINTEYALVAMAAVNALRKWPRPFVHWVYHFIPEVQRARSLLKDAREIMTPVFLARKAAITKKMRGGTFDETSPADALSWFEEQSRGRDYDPTVAQLSFAVAAIHATTDFLCQVLIDLSKYPKYIDLLREEITTEIRTHGWKPSTFSRMRLLDSVMKESQRLKPISLVFMKSELTNEIHLPNGGTLSQNTHLAVSAHAMLDCDVYEQANQFNGHRFLNPVKNSESRHFNSASPEHMGFGFGKHACPGRFFVTLEAKIILTYILLKYDLQFPEGQVPKVCRSGFDQVVDPNAKVLVRRRDPEIDLEALV